MKPTKTFLSYSLFLVFQLILIYPAIAQFSSNNGPFSRKQLISSEQEADSCFVCDPKDIYSADLDGLPL